MRLYRSATQQGYPGQRVVADLRGRLEALDPGATPTPAGLNLNGVLVSEELSKVHTKNPHNTCFPCNYWALGNEPSWSLQISEAEGLAEFSRLGAQTVRFDYSAPSIESEGSVLRYYFPASSDSK